MKQNDVEIPLWLDNVFRILSPFFSWIVAILWIVLSAIVFSPGGEIIDAMKGIIHIKWFVLLMNSLSFLGAYLIFRVILSTMIDWRSAKNEILIAMLVVYCFIGTIGFYGLNCEIYVWCSEDVPRIP